MTGRIIFVAVLLFWSSAADARCRNAQAAVLSSYIMSGRQARDAFLWQHRHEPSLYWHWRKR